MIWKIASMVLFAIVVTYILNLIGRAVAFIFNKFFSIKLPAEEPIDSENTTGE